MYRVVLDPVVLVSSVVSRQGTPARLVALWLEGAFDLVVSEQLLAELSLVLRREKFRRYLSMADASEFIGLVEASGSVHPDQPAVGATPDPADDYLVGLARSADAEFLVSGDRDLLGAGLRQPFVVTPRGLLDLLELVD